MFGFTRKEEAKHVITPEYATEIATAYKNALNEDNQVNVVITNNLDQSIEKQFSGATPEEIVTLYSFLQIRMKSMSESMENYKEYLKQSLELADEQLEHGLPTEQAEQMKDAAKAIFQARELSYKRLSSVVSKLEKLVKMVSDYSDTIDKEQLKKW